MDIITVLLFKHILPTIAGSALTLGLVLLFLTMFRIKRPAIRHAFLFIPLIKPLFTLIGGLNVPRLGEFFAQRPRKIVKFGGQLPDPFNLIALPDAKHNTLPDGSVLLPGVTKLYVIVGISIAFVTLCMLAIHWAKLLRLRRQLTHGTQADALAHKELIDIVRDLSEKARIKPPRIVIEDVPSPAMVGVISPTIIMPTGLSDELSRDEIEAILAHEIAHIKRKDSIWLWLSTVCRDLMYFNPIAWVVFKLLARERERAADTIAVRLTGKPIALAESLVKFAERILIAGDVKQPYAMHKSTFATKTSLEDRVYHLIGFKSYKRLRFRLAPLALLFLILFYFRLILYVNIPQVGLFSFFG